ncbi:MAG: hemerythrin family protein [Proteobacteria bacterium]|nr:hemerythrin family protein [Pseudomonadota bacterium]MBU1686878.1 hemerythrin family protein [Pseudomonadota bacterium]
MEWKKEYEHGILWQDVQHHQLLDQINELIRLVVSEERDEKGFNKVVNFVIQYCNNHFKIEEAYMTSHGYPRAKNHIAAHHQFIRDMKKLLSMEGENNKEKSQELLSSLMEWFVTHVLETDKYLAQFILKHKVS